MSYSSDAIAPGPPLAFHLLLTYAGPSWKIASMQRVTARILLVLALVGTFVPVGLALTAPAPHACCLRRAKHGGWLKPSFDAVDPGRGNCCPPVATPSWAQPVSSTNIATSLLAVTVATFGSVRDRFTEPTPSRPVRAPPVPSIA